MNKIEEYADELMNVYGKFGVERHDLIKSMKDGIDKYGLTADATYHGLRMMLGGAYGIQETFSQKDLSVMLGCSETDAVVEIENMRRELEMEGKNLDDYLLNVPEHPKFLVKPEKWN